VRVVLQAHMLTVFYLGCLPHDSCPLKIGRGASTAQLDCLRVSLLPPIELTGLQAPARRASSSLTKAESTSSAN